MPLKASTIESSLRSYETITYVKKAGTENVALILYLYFNVGNDLKACQPSFALALVFPSFS